MKSPKIRFKGFDGDWEQRKLGDVVDSVDTGKSKFNKEDSSGEYPILGSTSVIGYDDKYDYEGDFILTARVGANAGNLYRHAGKVKISDNTVFIQTSQNIEFLYQLLIQFDVKKLSFGTGQPLVKASELKNLELMMPTDMKEQMRIGMYLKNLDNLITLHQKKCEQLTILKKYMLQKMFPQNGSDKPEIRFEGFTDDWEQRKVSEIGNIVTGSTPKTSISDNYGGEFLFVSPADIQENRYVDETITTLTKKGFDQGRKIREKASLFVSIGSTIGKVAQTSQESTTNQQINAVEPYDNFDDDFIFTSLENISGSIKAIASNQAVPIVNKTTFGQTEIQVPSELAEQQKIGAYFRKLDHLITLHQQKCDELRNAKKFMLQNMFI